jgi:hypothetical protein
MGGFEDQRPLSVLQRTQQLDRRLEKTFGGQIVRSARPDFGLAAELQEWQPQQQQRTSSNSQEVVEVLKQLLQYAVGSAKPSHQQRLQCSQQVAKLLKDMEGELPYADWDAAADVEQHGEGSDTEHGGAYSSGGEELDARQAQGGGLNVQQRNRAGPSDAAAAANQAGSIKQGQRAARSRAGNVASAAVDGSAGTPNRQQQDPQAQDVVVMSDQYMTPSGQKYTRQQLRARTVSTISPGGHYTAFFSGQQQGFQRPVQQPQQQQQPIAAGGGVSGPEQQMQQLIAEAERLQEAMLLAQQDLADVEVEAHDMQGPLSEQEQQQLSILQVKQQQLSVEVQDLAARQRGIKLQLLDLRKQQRHQLLQQQQPTGPPYGQVPGAAAGFSQLDMGEGVLRQMGGSVDPVNEIFHPYTAQRGISLSAYEHVLPAMPQTGGVVPAFGKLSAQLEALAAAQGGGAAAATTTTTTTTTSGSSKQAYNLAGHGTAAAAPEAGAGAAGSAPGSEPQKLPRSSSSSKRKAYDFPTFGNKSVVQAVKWYHETPLADHLTAREEENCKGWTAQQLQMQGKDAWRGGKRGYRFQRWAEWVQLMDYLDAKQLQLSNEQGTVVGLLVAAAALDGERGKRSLTAYYKAVVVPWVQDREQQRQQQQQEQQSEDGGGSDGENEEAQQAAS